MGRNGFENLVKYCKWVFENNSSFISEPVAQENSLFRVNW